MAIINFSFSRKDAPAEAQGVHYGAGYRVWSKEDKKYVYAPGPQMYWIWKTHVGLCLNDYENKGYYDSNFFMTVWNEEKECPEEICFASIRGWSHLSYSSYVDATDEVKAKYAVWKVKQADEYRRKQRQAKAR